MLIKETKSTGEEVLISVFQNFQGKFQFVNLTKETIKPCEFNSEEEAFLDLLKYIKEGKIKKLEFDQTSKSPGLDLVGFESIRKRWISDD